ncbi:MAG: hypothetical protein WBO10_01170 [Pyrinomonadaceae bacterium]
MAQSGRNADALVRTESRFGPNDSTVNQLPEILTKASPEEPAIADEGVRVPTAMSDENTIAFFGLDPK